MACLAYSSEYNSANYWNEKEHVRHIFPQLTTYNTTCPTAVQNQQQVKNVSLINYIIVQQIKKSIERSKIYKRVHK